MEYWMEVGNGRQNNLVIDGEEFQWKQKEEVNRIRIHAYLFKLLDNCVTMFIVVFMFL
jgi:uncharacterized protein YjbK